MHDGILTLGILHGDIKGLARLSGEDFLAVHLGYIQAEYEVRLNALKVLAVTGGIFKAQVFQLRNKFLVLNGDIRVNLEHIGMVLLCQLAGTGNQLLHGSPVMGITNRTTATIHQCPGHMGQIADEHCQRTADFALFIPHNDRFPLPVVLQVCPLLGLCKMAEGMAHIKRLIFSQCFVIYKFKHVYPPA